MRLLLNILWFVLSGLWMALGYLFAALLCFITIIGIPFGIANFKLIPVSLLPLGRDVVTLDEARRTGAVIEVGVPADARRAG
jgi:uncharacterized membrane protein YccF (DUF307 family)